MPTRPPPRSADWITPSFVLTLVLAASWALGGAADALLTPLPGSWMGITMTAAFALAFGLAWMIAQAIPSRLAQRLTVIGVMALTLYASGQSARGLYAWAEFSGGASREQRVMLVTATGSGAVQVVDREFAGPARTLPASLEVVSSTRRGGCVAVPVERSPDGAMRLAPGKVELAEGCE